MTRANSNYFDFYRYRFFTCRAPRRHLLSSSEGVIIALEPVRRCNDRTIQLIKRVSFTKLKISLNFSLIEKFRAAVGGNNEVE